MSAAQPQQPQEREVVFCHQCENEWYRDEHGLVCPECQGDFVEVIEANNDPREEAPDAGDFGAFAPDPSEDDIDNFEWRNNGSGQPPGGHYHGTMHRNITLQPGHVQGQGGQGIMGLIGQALGPALQGILGGQQTHPGQQRAPGQEVHPGGMPQSPPAVGGTTTRTGGGPGFSYTITTSTRSNFGPRDANQPQPFANQPEHIDRMMAQMFMNIGAMPGHGHPPHHHHGGGIIFGVPPGSPGQHGDDAHPMAGGPMGLGNIFQMLGLGLPPGGVAGDHVYTQEGFDRIMTQLMQQHQAGNAPPPATEEAINALPKRKITEKDLNEGDDGKAICSICMDDAELDSEVTELPCHHWFHFDCIKAWLTEHDTCPHCRQGITPKEGEQAANRPRQPGEEPRHDMHSPEYQRGHVANDSVSRATSDTIGTRRQRFAASMDRATQNIRNRSSSGHEHRVYHWMNTNVGGHAQPTNQAINTFRTSPVMQTTHPPESTLSFGSAVRSDLRAVGRAFRLRRHHQESYHQESPDLERGQVIYRVLQGGNRGRIAVAAVRPRTHSIVERRLSRRLDARLLADIPGPGPSVSRTSRDHERSSELDSDLGRGHNSATESGDSAADEEFVTSTSSSLCGHWVSRNCESFYESTVSAIARKARHHSWVRRYAMGESPVDDGP